MPRCLDHMMSAITSPMSTMPPTTTSRIGTQPKSPGASGLPVCVGVGCRRGRARRRRRRGGCTRRRGGGRRRWSRRWCDLHGDRARQERDVVVRRALPGRRHGIAASAAAGVGRGRARERAGEHRRGLSTDEARVVHRAGRVAPADLAGRADRRHGERRGRDRGRALRVGEGVVVRGRARATRRVRIACRRSSPRRRSTCRWAASSSDPGWSPLRKPLNDGVTAGVAPRWPVASPAVIVSGAFAIVMLPFT